MLSHRWVIGAVAVWMLCLVVGGVWIYRAQEQSLRAQTETDLQAIAQLKVDQIVSFRAGQIEDAEVISASPGLASMVGGFVIGTDPQARSDILTRFQAELEYHHYSDIILVDPNGSILLSAGRESPSLTPTDLNAVATAFRERKPVLTDIYQGATYSTQYLSAVAPIYDRSDRSTPPLAAVILRREAQHEIYPVVQSWPTNSATAETLIVRRDGDSALFLNELRHQKGTALTLRFPLTQTDVPAVKAVLGYEGVFQGVDYRGVSVISVLKPVPNSNWFVVAKQDTDEALAVWRQASILIVTVFFVMAAAGAAAAGMAWQQQSKAHYYSLFLAEAASRKAEERYRTTLYSVGDGVIATDATGGVEIMNSVAEALTGWTQAEASGRPLTDVFKIVNEQTREPVESPVERCLREGKVVGLANHTVLISRDGKEYPVADSGAPIRGEDTTLGVVLVFRDQTEERRAAGEIERTTRLNQILLDAFPCVAMLVRPQTGEIVASNQTARTYGAVPGQTCYSTWGRADGLCQGCLATEVWETGQPRQAEMLVDGTYWDAHWTPISSDLYMHFAFDVTERKHAEDERARLQDQLTQAQKMEAVGRLAGGIAHDFNNMLGVIIGHVELALMEMPSSNPVYNDLQEIGRAAERSASLTRQLLAYARRQIVTVKVVDLNDAVTNTLSMLRRLVGEDVDVRWLPRPDVWSVRIDPSQLDQILTNLVVNAREAIPGVGRITIETANRVFDEAYCADHVEFTPGKYAMLAVSDDGVGMPPDVVEHIFEPFFTTKQNTSGTGLGLATVYGIVRQHDGFINAYSEPGSGSTFRIYFPRCASDSVEVPSEPPPLVVPQDSRTVLVVEDEPAILHIAQTMLGRLGYSVLVAKSPTEALEIVRSGGSIDLLITDVVMPEMNGRDLAQAVQAVQPNVRCLFMSGYTANVIAHHGVLDEGVQFIQKPFSVNDLSAKVQEVLRG